MNFGKKKNVPDELPALISDEIEKESLDEINSALKEEKKEEPKNVPEESLENKAVEKKEMNRNVVNRLIKNVEETPNREMKAIPSDKSFFADLQEKIVNDLDDVEALEKWYNGKSSSGDLVTKMKSYWNSQKRVSVLDIMAKNFKEKISVKVSELQKLEKDWQNVYFELVEKEELIKEAEAGLREMVSEFMTICKDKKEAMSRNHFEESLSIKNNSNQVQNNSSKRKRNKKKKKQSIINGGENVEKKEEQFSKE